MDVRQHLRSMVLELDEALIGVLQKRHVMIGVDFHDRLVAEIAGLDAGETERAERLHQGRGAVRILERADEATMHHGLLRPVRQLLFAEQELHSPRRLAITPSYALWFRYALWVG